MPGSKQITVVVIQSLSFSGSTWLNTVLGGHEKAFALGPPDRIWNLRSTGWDRVCCVHDQSCDFWPAFHREYDPQRNMFVQIAEFSGKDWIITNNPVPDGAGRELSHPDIKVMNIQLVRDGRAVLASYLRKHPQIDPYEGIMKWLYPSFSAIAFDPGNPDIHCVRYEDLLKDPRQQLQRLGEFVGLDYDERALKIWEFEHHITAGNQGTISLIRQGQGISITNFEDHEFYREQFQRINAGGSQDFKDERWHRELSAENLLLFDLCLGSDNERFGYERDKFALSELGQFFTHLKEAPGERAEILREVDSLDQRLFNSLEQISPTGGPGRLPAVNRANFFLLLKLLVHYGVSKLSHQVIPPKLRRRIMRTRVRA